MKGPEKQNLSHEAEILDLIITHPWLLETEDELFSSFKFTTEDAKTLRDALLEVQFIENPQNSLDSAAGSVPFRKVRTTLTGRPDATQSHPNRG